MAGVEQHADCQKTLGFTFLKFHVFTHLHKSVSRSVLEIEGGKVYGKQCTRVIYLYSLFTLSISICIYLDLSVFIWISKLKVVKFMANIARP